MRLRILLAVAAVAGIALAAWSQRAAVAAIDLTSDPGGIALALGLLAVAPLLQAATFVLGLRATGAPADAVPTLRMWSRSYLLRYEPSGALGFVHRVAGRAPRRRVDARRSSPSPPTSSSPRSSRARSPRSRASWPPA